MIAFNEVARRVEQLLILQTGRKHIYNKEIAEALGLTAEYYAVIKKRGKIPYRAIALFCRTNRISMNWILFGQEPRTLALDPDQEGIHRSQKPHLPERQAKTTA